MRQPSVLTMILAGGVGERLYPLTANRSKPAVPFGGNFRIIDFTLMNCVLSGLRRIHLLTQYHSVSLERHKCTRWGFLSRELGEFIDVVPPSMRTMTGYYKGTADAIYRNLDLLDRTRPDLVLVLSGDHIYRADYGRFIEAHLERDADITVLCDSVDVPQATSFGVIEDEPDGRIINFVEKPLDPSPYARDGKCSINLGVYCFQTTFLVSQLVADSKRKTAHDFGKNILPDSLERGSVLTCPLDCICPDPEPYWRDVGTIDSYFQASMDLLSNPPAFDLRDPRWPEGSSFREWLPARVSARPHRENGGRYGASLVSSSTVVEPATISRSILSPAVRVGEGSEIEECILFRGVEVGAGAKLRRAIVEEGVRIPPGERIGYGGDSRNFTTSDGGVVVVNAGYRFDEPRRPASHGSPARQREIRRAPRPAITPQEDAAQRV